MTTHIGNKFLSSFKYQILDSGATDHICSSLTHFTSYHQSNHICVKLPNGNQVIANYYGSVLYILCFTFNLLSVAKLIDNLSCVLTFDSNSYHIKDNNSLKMIGLTKMQDRLYILSFYHKLKIQPTKSTVDISLGKCTESTVIQYSLKYECRTHREQF